MKTENFEIYVTTLINCDNEHSSECFVMEYVCAYFTKYLKKGGNIHNDS